jgi:hypothetical protein
LLAENNSSVAQATNFATKKRVNALDKPTERNEINEKPGTSRNFFHKMVAVATDEDALPVKDKIAHQDGYASY